MAQALSHALSARPDNQAAGRAERHNRGPGSSPVGLVVGMKPHAVIAAPVAVRENVVEGHPSPLAGAREMSPGCGVNGCASSVCPM